MLRSARKSTDRSVCATKRPTRGEALRAGPGMYYDSRPPMSETAAPLTSNSTDAAAGKPRDSASEMLWGFWYPALPSARVRGRKLERAMLLEVPLVIGRDSAGKPRSEARRVGKECRS